jgi:hypothetical protein
MSAAAIAPIIEPICHANRCVCGVVLGLTVEVAVIVIVLPELTVTLTGVEGDAEMRFARQMPPSAVIGPIVSPPLQRASTHVPA